MPVAHSWFDFGTAVTAVSSPSEVVSGEASCCTRAAVTLASSGWDGWPNAETSPTTYNTFFPAYATPRSVPFGAIVEVSTAVHVAPFQCSTSGRAPCAGVLIVPTAQAPSGPFEAMPNRLPEPPRSGSTALVQPPAEYLSPQAAASCCHTSHQPPTRRASRRSPQRR
jgi:hypothetical protein